LRNDRASAAKWVEAGDAITEPSNVVHQGSVRLIDPGRPKRLRGERLRAGFGAEIRELLAKRAFAVERFDGRDAQDDALALGIDLGRWDAKAGTPTMRELCRRFLKTGRRGSETVEERFVRLIVYRLKGGDRTAAADYSAFLAQYGPSCLGTMTNQLEPFQIDLLQPFWETPNGPGMPELEREFFGDWARRVASRDGHQSEKALADAVGTGWTRVMTRPAYRRVWVSGLGCRTVVGSVLPQDRSIESRLFGGFGTWSVVARGESSAISSVQPLLACDFLASQLARIYQGRCPNFQVYWPERRREAALSKVRAWIAAPHPEFGKPALGGFERAYE
jgi:hypothetical protein